MMLVSTVIGNNNIDISFTDNNSAVEAILTLFICLYLFSSHLPVNLLLNFLASSVRPQNKVASSEE